MQYLDFNAFSVYPLRKKASNKITFCGGVSFWLLPERVFNFCFEPGKSISRPANDCTFYSWSSAVREYSHRVRSCRKSCKMNLPLFTKAKIIKNAKNFANFRKVKNHAYRRILGFSLHETLKHAPILPLHLKNAGKSSKNKFKNLTENAKNLILSNFFRPQIFFF